MKIVRFHKGVRYFLTNENLQVGDEVFSVLHGLHLADGFYPDSMWYHEIKECPEFPDDPAIVTDLDKMDHCGNPVNIYTDKGYGHKDAYFKIYKKMKRGGPLPPIGSGIPSDDYYTWLEFK